MCVTVLHYMSLNGIIQTCSVLLKIILYWTGMFFKTATKQKKNLIKKFIKKVFIATNPFS